MTPTATSSSTFEPQIPSDPPGTLYTNMLTALIVFGSVLFFVVYVCALTVTHRYAQNHPRGLNKDSGIRVQNYAPAFYIFLVAGSLVEVSLSGWLLTQDAYLGDIPNTQTRIGTTLLLFCACWTSVTSSVYSMLFLHPRWAEHILSSIGAQSLWLFLTWVLWIVGTGLLNGAVPGLLLKAHCGALAHCGQIQGLFGVAIITIFMLTTGLVILIWLAMSSVFPSSLKRLLPTQKLEKH